MGVPPIEPTIADIVLEGIASALQDVYTAIPAEVTRFDRSKNVCDALPLIYRPVFDTAGNRTFEKLPLVQHVPVQFPNGGGTSMRWKPKNGDKVLLLCSMWNVGQWFATGEAGDPGDVTTHPLAGAIALAGVVPVKDQDDETPTSDGVMVLHADEEVRLGGVGASNAVSLAPAAKTEMDIIVAALKACATTAGATIPVNLILAAYTGQTGASKVKAI